MNKPDLTLGTSAGSQGENKGGDDIRTQLADHVGSLHFINSALMTCVNALQRQDAEMDRDIALVLQRTVGDKLDETIERIESIALGIEFAEG